jgi:hypothetical protein
MYFGLVLAVVIWHAQTLVGVYLATFETSQLDGQLKKHKLALEMRAT